MGAAATQYRNGKEIKTLHKYLGQEEHHTVFEAELVGTIIGAHMAQKENSEAGIAICVDNQAAITTTTMAKQMAAQYLVMEAQDTLTHATRQQQESSVTLRWVPGHKGVEGNERADEEAKLAARGKYSKPKDLPQALEKVLPISKTAALQTQKAKFAKESVETHLSSKRIDRMKDIDPSMPSNNFAKRAKFLSRRHAAMLIRLRSGHIPLSQYLHRIGKRSSPLYQECGKVESVFHYLIECRQYALPRKKLEKKLKRNARSIKALPSNPFATTALFEYVNETGRFRGMEKELRFTKEGAERWNENINKKRKVNRQREQGRA